MDVTVYKMNGTENGKMSLPEELFGTEINPTLVHQVIVAQDANNRARYAQTKDRSEVRGGGRKPWRQKGTGRARHGSRRSPIWIGGGVTFGPQANKNFSKKVNKQVKQKALAIALSDKVKENALIIVDELTVPEAKTKVVNEMRSKLPGSDDSALIIAAPENKAVKRASSNLAKTEAISANSINVRDLVKYKYVIASKDAVEAIIKRYKK